MTFAWTICNSGLLLLNFNPIVCPQEYVKRKLAIYKLATAYVRLWTSIHTWMPCENMIKSVQNWGRFFSFYDWLSNGNSMANEIRQILAMAWLDPANVLIQFLFNLSKQLSKQKWKRFSLRTENYRRANGSWWKIWSGEQIESKCVTHFNWIM